MRKRRWIPDPIGLWMQREEYPAGLRVRLVKMDDPQAPPVGTMGTVRGVDNMGDILIDWDNGSHLKAIYEEDKVEVVW